MTYEDCQLNRDKNGLEAGTVLDKRYRILRKVGEGGFGITYEAENIHTSFRVAIKESKFEKDRFLMEARLLGDFRDDPAIVSVVESFQENDAAYIVMEYLDGSKLSDVIKEQGKWSAEKTVRTFVPIMEALERMHAAGVIHRDISPDNLMYMPDDFLILMDFGAAKEFRKASRTIMPIYKDHYSPPEQQEGLTMGSYTDVYALCATMYYCLTGEEPESPGIRLLGEDLKAPSRNGSDILPEAEDILLKGMELDSDARLQDVKKLQTVMEKIYPDVSEEEKKELARRQLKKKRIRRWCLCAAALLAALLAFVFRTQILFRFIDTETVLLSGREMSDTAFADSAAAVRQRVEAIAGEEGYIWHTRGKEISFEMPMSVYTAFGEVDPKAVIRSAVSRPMVMSVYWEKEKNWMENMGVFSQTEDIAAFRAGEDAAEVVFTEDAAKRLEEILDREGEELRFIFDYEKEYSNTLAYTGLTIGDGKTVLVSRNTLWFFHYQDASLIYREGFEIPSGLQKLHFTEKPTEDALLVHAKWDVKWERIEDTLFPGKNQRNSEDISGSTVCMRYLPPLDEYDEDGSGYDPAFLSFQVILKNRLDSLRIPYAVGRDRFQEYAFVIKVPTDKVWMEEMENLCEYVAGSDFTFGNSKVNYTGIQEPVSIEDNGNGSFSLRMDIPEDKREEAEDILKAIAGQEDPRLLLYYEYSDIAVCDAAEALKSLQETGSIRFSNWTFTQYPDMDDSTRHLADFFLEAAKQNPEGYYNMDLSSLEVTDAQGHLVPFDYEDLLPESVFNTDKDEEAERLIESWREEYDGILTFAYYGSTKALYVDGISADLEDPELSLRSITEFYQKYQKELNGGAFRSVTFSIKKTLDNSATTPRVSIGLDMSLKECRFTLDDVYAYTDDDAIREYLQSAYREYLAQNGPWQ